MMMRTAAIIAALVLAGTGLHANSEDPLSWVPQRDWSFHAMRFNSGWLLHQPRTAWASSQPVISIHDVRGNVVAGSEQGLDIGDVHTWRNMIVAVQRTSAGYDLLLMDGKLSVVAQTTLAHREAFAGNEVVQIAADDRHGKVFIRLTDVVVCVDVLHRPLQATFIEEGVRGMGALRRGADGVAIVHDVGGVAFVAVVDTTLNRRIAPAVPLAPYSSVVEAGSTLVVLSPIDRTRGTQVTVVDVAVSTTRTTHVQASIDLVHPIKVDSVVALARVELIDGRFQLIISSLEDGTLLTDNVPVLPSEYGAPVSVRALGDTIFVLFTGGLVTCAPDGNILSRDAMEMQVDGASVQIVPSNLGMLISSATGSILLRQTSHPLWWVVRGFFSVGAFAVPALLLVVIGFLWQQLRRQRRFLDAMLELPGAGLVFVMDAAGRLTRTNERASKLVRISNRVPMGRSFHSYVQHGGVEGVRWFLEQAYTERRPMSEKVSVDDGDEQREYVFTAVPLFGTLGRLRGIVVTGVDITEALERRRLVNWAQLAHDMQTNLSTIRLNAEQLDPSRTVLTSGRGVDDAERIKRILFQTRILIQRVRDLVSVGRSEDLVRSPVHSAEFCTELRHEFDPEMFPNVTFSMKLRGTMMNVDRLKLSRAVRNAVENAIKSLRGQPGTVEIATWSDRTNVYIRISDSGVGMDTLTLENMMKPYFTTAKDGSGTGIGTMIMQHVTHLHGGALRVTSEPGIGTQVVFRIPHHMDGGKGATAYAFAAEEALA